MGLFGYLWTLERFFGVVGSKDSLWGQGPYLKGQTIVFVGAFGDPVCFGLRQVEYASRNARWLADWIGLLGTVPENKCYFARFLWRNTKMRSLFGVTSYWGLRTGLLRSVRLINGLLKLLNPRLLSTCSPCSGAGEMAKRIIMPS